MAGFRIVTDHTIIAQPLVSNVAADVKVSLMEKRNKVLGKVKEYIDTNFNPSTKTFYDPSQDSYEPALSINEILSHLKLTRAEYEDALSISDDNSFQIHTKRPPNSCFVNSYFADGLLAWEANLDIKPVFNHSKAISYMCTYLSKSEDEYSHAIQEAFKDAFRKNLDNYNQMKSIAHAYTNNRECSVQECLYHVLPGQWLRKTFPGVIFANSNIPEKRFRVCLNEEEISELPENSQAIFRRNMLDRYKDHPNSSFANGKSAIIDSMCCAEFFRYYYLMQIMTNENDYRPEELTDQLIQGNHPFQHNYPEVIPLMSSKEKLKCHKIPNVLQYYEPNRHVHPENYYHHMLFM